MFSIRLFFITFFIVSRVVSQNETVTSEFCDNTTDCITSTEITDTTIYEVTEIETSKPTTQTPSTTTPTSTTTNIPKNEDFNRASSECLCDLTSEKCDINCCCDTDCNESDRTLFSFCSSDSFRPFQHSGLCFSHEFIYLNNTRYKISKTEKGLFCITKDNFPDRLYFTDQKAIQSLEKFNKVWNRKRHFEWTQFEQKTIKTETQNYKFGSPLLKYDNSTNIISKINFPIKLTSSYCSSTREVAFLENMKSDCLQKGPTDALNCETDLNFNSQHFCDNLRLISKPGSFNSSNPEETGEELIDVKMFFCDGNCREVSSLPNPTFNNSVCTNVVQSVFLTIYHNGSNGITEGKCEIHTTLVEIDSYFSQTFEVGFKWAKNDTNFFRRSGTPGYHENKPLLSSKFLESLEIDIKNTNSLKIVGNQKETCYGQNDVLFKENVKMMCSINFSENRLSSDGECFSLYNEIWTLLMNEANETNGQLDYLISSYGDPMSEKIHWVPIYVENTNSEYTMKKSPCRNLLSGVSYQILYSYFGPFSNPQAKIIGATVKFLTRRVSCDSSICRHRITSSVNFIDASQHAVNKFAKAPVVTIKLPQDFFYPFSSKCSSSTFSPLLIVFSYSLMFFS